MLYYTTVDAMFEIGTIYECDRGIRAENQFQLGYFLSQNAEHYSETVFDSDERMANYL